MNFIRAKMAKEKANRQTSQDLNFDGNSLEGSLFAKNKS